MSIKSYIDERSVKSALEKAYQVIKSTGYSGNIKNLVAAIDKQKVYNAFLDKMPRFKDYDWGIRMGSKKTIVHKEFYQTLSELVDTFREELRIQVLVWGIPDDENTKARDLADEE